MLRAALLFLIFALVAGVLGFGALEGTAMNIAWILFVVFLIMALASFVLGGRGPRSIN